MESTFLDDEESVSTEKEPELNENGQDSLEEKPAFSKGHPNYAENELNPEDYVASEEELESEDEEGGENEEEPEPLFENHCTVNKELYFEAVKAMSNRTKDLVIAIICAVLVPICFMLGNPVLAVVALIVAIVALSYRSIVGSRDFRRLKARHPEGEWTKRVRIYDEYVVTDSEEENDDNVTVVALQDLKKIRETEHLCILDFGKTAPATLMDKDGFQIGSVEELRMLKKNLDKAEADRRANS